MTKNNYVVIMAGGKGTRLWPLSRNSKPKQLQNFIGTDTMIQDTYKRVVKLIDPSHIYISTNKNYIAEIKKQLPEIPKSNYIIEPIARNTGPAIGLVAVKISNINPDAVITTIASDHVVTKVDNFLESIEISQDMVTKDPSYIGTIGIKPTTPHTGFGYIQKGKFIKEADDAEIYKVKQFVEKPDFKTAKKYLESKDYFWNASYFTFSAKNILDLFKQYEPEIYKHLISIKKAYGKSNEQETIKKEFLNMPELAFDYLVEKINNIFIVPADLGWDDIGSWEAIKNIISQIEEIDTPERGNHIGIDNENSLIYAQDKLIATIGLKNVVIVDTNDAILICDKSKTQDVKKIIEKLQSDKKYQKYL